VVLVTFKPLCISAFQKRSNIKFIEEKKHNGGGCLVCCKTGREAHGAQSTNAQLFDGYRYSNNGIRIRFYEGFLLMAGVI